MRKNNFFRISKFLWLQHTCLPDYGFVPDSIVMADVAPGRITLELRTETVADYEFLVKYARERKLRILQVSKTHQTIRGTKNMRYYILMDDVCLCRSGFKTGERLTGDCEYGFIQLQRPLS